MSHGQDEGQVGARVDRHPLIGERDGVVQTRVDDHQLGAVLVRLLHGMQLARLDRVGVAAADEHRHLGVHHVGGEVTRADDLGKPGVFRHVTSGAVRVDVRAAERVHETLGVIRAARARVLHHSERLGALLVDDRLDLLGNLAVGLIPRNLLELAAVFLERVGQAILVVGDGGEAVAAAAQRALAVRMVCIADHLAELAVNDVSREPAFR